MKKTEHPKQDKKYIYDLIVIGGGPAGMMAAGTAAKLGKNVLLLEKNRELGKKLKITGGGRCNITNAELDNRILLENYADSKDFLFSPFSQFSVKDTFEFFESRNLPLVVEARNRAFPKTQKALDVFKVMQKYVRDTGVEIMLDAKVTKINTDDGKIKSVTVNGNQIYAENFVISTGGNSYPETGSTGEGLIWLSKLGHKIKESNPNIVPLKVAERWVKKLSGVSVSFMKITFYLNGKKSFSKTGKILFTHFGLSSPLILNIANKVSNLLEKGEVTAKIDLYPDSDLGSLDKNIVKIFDKNKNKQLKNVIKEIVPKGMHSAFSDLIDIDVLDTEINLISKDFRKEFGKLLKNMPITITGLMGYDWAVISDGGVLLEDVDTKTMQSKIHSNLYLIGDVLNINRPSGGFSLQLCWTTGYVAGKHIGSQK